MAEEVTTNDDGQKNIIAIFNQNIDDNELNKIIKTPTSSSTIITTINSNKSKIPELSSNRKKKVILENNEKQINSKEKNGKITNGSTENYTETIKTDFVITQFKKSVSFQSDDESITKFINGEVIIDKQNPFRGGTITRNNDYSDKKITKKASSLVNNTPRRRKKKDESLDDNENEFVSKEDVLRESKFVKTYIKNPDTVFKYDRSILERLKSEDESTDEVAIIPKTKLPTPLPRRIPCNSRLSDDNIRNLKERYSPPDSYIQNKKVVNHSGTILRSSLKEKKQETHKPLKQVGESGIKYPDLSDLKVKTGTDVDESYFNTAEVAKNVKRFDTLLKSVNLGSEDDLDEIENITTEVVAHIDESDEKEKTNANNDEVDNFQSSEPSDDVSKKSFTTIVNSKEFEEFLKKNGLSLPSPKIENSSKNNLNGNLNNQKSLNSSAPIANTGRDKVVDVNGTMESRNVKSESLTPKKRSVLQRFFHAGFFSKDKSTAPVKQLPEKPIEDNRNSGLKRMVPERASYHGGSSSSYKSNNELNRNLRAGSYILKPKELNKQKNEDIENALESRKEIPSGSYATQNQAFQSYPQQAKSLKVRSQSGRNSAPIEINNAGSSSFKRTDKRLTPIQNKSRVVPVVFENHPQIIQRDGIIRPQVQRPNIINNNLQSPQPQQLNQGNNFYYHQNRGPTQVQKADSRSMSNCGDQTQVSLKTPNNSQELIFDMKNGPKSTSTPINEKENLVQKENKQVPAESTTTKVIKPMEIDPLSWVKLKELQQNTDCQFYSRPPIPTPSKNVYEHETENIYETTESIQLRQKLTGNSHMIPTNAQVHQSMNNQLLQNNIKVERETGNKPHYSSNADIRHSVQRNTNGEIYGDRRLYDNNNPDPRYVKYIKYNDQIYAAVPSMRPISQQGQYVDNRQRNQNQLGHVREVSQRSQSVLDNMTTQAQAYQEQRNSIYGIIGRQRSATNETPVVLRRKTSQSTLSRDEIMARVKDYCMKSMRNTPSLQGSTSQLSVAAQPMNSPTTNPTLTPNNQKESTTKISPVSYVSVESRASNISGRQASKPSPQVPQRVQSLQPQQKYIQHERLPSRIVSPLPENTGAPYFITNYNTQTVPTSAKLSGTPGIYDTGQIPDKQQEVILLTQNNTNENIPISNNQRVQYQPQQQQPYSVQSYIVMDSEKITPKHIMQYRHQDPNIIYGRTSFPAPPQQPKSSQQMYAVIDRKNQPRRASSVMQQPTNYFTYDTSDRSLRSSFNSGGRLYGRTTPIVLHGNTQIPLMSPRPMSLQKNNKNADVDFETIEKMYRPINNSYQDPFKNVKPPRQYIESESGSEAGEVQRIMQFRQPNYEEDWQNDKSNRNQQMDQAVDDRRRGGRREDPRRHTLGGDMLHYGQQVGSAGGGMNSLGLQGGVSGGSLQRSMDLEMGTRSQKVKKAPPVRGYTPVNQGPLFDDDPGIMSEVETASTGFRRGGKQRSSLPVVRTPSKTLERPLGLVFLQYRSETKRALLPNEITSIDTVRALFVRSFPRQLTMAYLEGPNVKIYIHDAGKDMFYELEDVRSHLREIRDRSVLRLFESNEVAAPQVLPGGPGIPQPLPSGGGTGHWDQDQSYFSEPEFDSEYQHQHIHKSKGGGKNAPYYVGAAQTLPRGMYSDRNKNAVGAPLKPLRSYGGRGSMGSSLPYPPDQLYSIPDGYMSSPERGTRSSYEEPYYSQYGTRGGTVTPIIDEEQSDTQMADEYSLYGVKVASGRIPRNSNQLYDPTRPEDLHRIRVEHMERQLANLTGLVQKALTQNPQIPTGIVSGTLSNQNYLGVPGQCRGVPDDIDGHSSSSSTSIQANGTGDETLYIREKPPKLGKSSCHKSVSFEKSVSFSDDIPQGLPKSHSPQHPADSKPPKPAIKSSTLPRTSSQERDRLKPPPPPKPLSLAPSHPNYRPDIQLAPEVYNHLRSLQKKTKELRTEVRTLRRLSQAQAIAVREDIKDTFMRVRATLLASSSGSYWGQGDQEKTRLSREEELYKQEVIRLEKDLGDLESSVEGLRGEVINRRTRVNMAAVEDMALVLSRASKTVAELKMKFPGLQQGLRNVLSNEMEKVVREEKFLKDEPDRLESALRRCKKLTGTLVTLKRLASVQEQRLPCAEPPSEEPQRNALETPQTTNKPIPSPRLGTVTFGGGVIAPENALDALLDELQTFAKPGATGSTEPRPDDSTSDDSSQTLQNTVSTQLSQSSMYPQDPAAAAVAIAAGGVNLNNNINNINNLNNNNNNNLNNNINNNNNNNNININNNDPCNTTISNLNQIVGLRRLHSYPSGSDTDTSPPQPSRPSGKPPVPERNADLLNKVCNKRIPPPPPPRTSSRSPLASPTSPNIPIRLPAVNENQMCILNDTMMLPLTPGSEPANSSSNESVNSQDHVQRQLALELRHQELLKKQKMLQEQYARLQQISKNSVAMPPTDIMQLKKTGSESNLPQKMGLSMSVSGSMKNLLNNNNNNLNNINNNNIINNNNNNNDNSNNGLDNGKMDVCSGGGGVGQQMPQQQQQQQQQVTTNKVYETDIL